MKKRILSLALALVMVLALAAPALAADDGWQEYTMVYGDCDIHFSKCKLSQTAVNTQEPEEAAGSPMTATVITVAVGSTIDTRFNEKVTQVSEGDKEYLLEEFEANSLEDLIGVECWAMSDLILWCETDQVYHIEIAWNLENGTVTEAWHQDNYKASYYEDVEPGIPYLYLRNETGGYDRYLVVAENYPIHEMEAGFTDVGTAYADAVKWATESKFAEAKSATTFGAETPCPRGEVVEILWKALGCPEPTSTVNPFTDVKETDSFYKAVLWAAENGITTGTDKTHFSPNDTVKRCDAMTFIWRAASKPGSTAANPFGDVPAGQYYTTPVLWAVEKGITTGTTAATFSPMNPVTRAQMVTFLYRQLVEKA